MAGTLFRRAVLSRRSDSRASALPDPAFLYAANSGSSFSNVTTIANAICSLLCCGTFRLNLVRQFAHIVASFKPCDALEPPEPLHLPPRQLPRGDFDPLHRLFQRNLPEHMLNQLVISGGL